MRSGEMLDRSANMALQRGVVAGGRPNPAPQGETGVAPHGPSRYAEWKVVRQPTAAGEGGELVVFFGSPWESEAERWNRRVQENSLSGLLIVPLAEGILWGPLMVAGLGACLECLKTQHELGALEAGLLSAGAAVSDDPVRSLLLARRFLESAAPSDLLGRVYRIDQRGTVVGSERIAKFSDCPACGGKPSPAEIYYATQLFKKPDRGANGPGTL